MNTTMDWIEGEVKRKESMDSAGVQCHAVRIDIDWQPMSIEPSQCRAARALINMNQLELAHAANLGTATVKRFEVGLRTLIPNNMKAVIQALEDAGIEFIPRTKTKGPGVRLRE